MASLESFVAEVRACSRCAAHLPHGVRPVFQFDPRARILIAGQAPGRGCMPRRALRRCQRRASARLAGVDRATFYDPACFAILPLGFCYPGRGASGDLPPRAECAAAWRAGFMARFERLEFTVLLGRYAIAYHLAVGREPLTDVVRGWQAHWPWALPLPHPSPRNNAWMARNPWFEQTVLPALRMRVAALLDKA